DRAFKTSLDTAAKGVARGLERGDASEVLPYTTVEERAILGLDEKSLKGLLDWYRSCGGDPSGEVKIEGGDHTPSNGVQHFGHLAILKPNGFESDYFLFEDTTAGFRTEVVSSLVESGIAAKYGNTASKASKNLLQLSDGYVTEAPVLTGLGLEGVLRHGRLMTWKQLSEERAETADRLRLQGR
ncbi:MAG: hypothetical protein ABUL72_00165, partial [Armatimonadota bacterium]